MTRGVLYNAGVGVKQLGALGLTIVCVFANAFARPSEACLKLKAKANTVGLSVSGGIHRCENKRCPHQTGSEEITQLYALALTGDCETELENPERETLEHTFKKDLEALQPEHEKRIELKRKQLQAHQKIAERMSEDPKFNLEDVLENMKKIYVKQIFKRRSKISNEQLNGLDFKTLQTKLETQTCTKTNFPLGCKIEVKNNTLQVETIHILYAYHQPIGMLTDKEKIQALKEGQSITGVSDKNDLTQLTTRLTTIPTQQNEDFAQMISTLTRQPIADLPPIETHIEELALTDTRIQTWHEKDQKQQANFAIVLKQQKEKEHARTLAQDKEKQATALNSNIQTEKLLTNKKASLLKKLDNQKVPTLKIKFETERKMTLNIPKLPSFKKYLFIIDDSGSIYDKSKVNNDFFIQQSFDALREFISGVDTEQKINFGFTSVNGPEYFFNKTYFRKVESTSIIQQFFLRSNEILPFATQITKLEIELKALLNGLSYPESEELNSLYQRKPSLNILRAKKKLGIISEVEKMVLLPLEKDSLNNKMNKKKYSTIAPNPLTYTQSFPDEGMRYLLNKLHQIEKPDVIIFITDGQIEDKRKGYWNIQNEKDAVKNLPSDIKVYFKPIGDMNEKYFTTVPRPGIDVVLPWVQ